MGDPQDETKALLQNEARTANDNYNSTDNASSVNLPTNTTNGQTLVSAIGPDELPPSYQTAIHGNAPMVTCRVCQAMIDVSGKRDQHVVKCSNCNEATPIRNPPPGKKYVRCPCNCLLICKSSSQRIACPRPNCKRIINLSPSPVTPPLPTMPGMCKVTCVYCRDTFLFNTLRNALARCPHCKKVSSVGPQFAKCRGKIFLVMAFISFIIGTGITAGTYQYASINGGYIFAYLGAFLIGIILLTRSIYYYTMKVSTIEGPI